MREPKTIAEKLRYEIKLLGNDRFFARHMKHIQSYAHGIDNLLTLGEIEQLPLVEGEKRSFKATRKLKKWDYAPEVTFPQRMIERKHYHASRRVVVVKEIDLPGWRSIMPQLFNDPYYALKGKVTTVNEWG
jgi:hypothetical protein